MTSQPIPTRARLTARRPAARRRRGSVPVSAAIGSLVVVTYALLASFAPLIAPFGQAQLSGAPFLPPGGVHLLGTDQLGRDVFSRLVYGARTSIGFALMTTSISFLLGGIFGMLAAAIGSWFDQVAGRVVDTLMSIPVLVFSLMLLAIFGKSLANLVAILAVLDAPRVFRLTRAVSMNVVVMDYLEAARLRGEGLFWILRREILPNIRTALIAEFGVRFCFVFLTIGALSFLGVGVQPPTADWGSMVAENKTLIIYGNPTPLYPAAAMAVLAISINFVVDGILGGARRRRALD